MSLSARITLRPSRRLAVFEWLVAAGGVAVAASALVARWPSWTGIVLIGAAGCGACLALLAKLARRRGDAVIVVSDRVEVGLIAMDADDVRSWRLAEGTMVWPGLSIVALASDGPARRTLVVPDRDLDEGDRRVLHRFLLWTLRGGAGRRVGET